MKNEGFTVVEFLISFIAMTCVVGYIINIIKLAILVTSNTADFSVMIVTRVAGVFLIPLGCVLGYF